MKTFWLATAAFAGALAFGTLAPVASYADSMSGDCSSADSGLMKAMQSGDSSMLKTSGDVDKDFASAMMSVHSSGVALAKVEVKCGKDAKAKAMARKYLDDSDAEAAELRALLLGGH
ncbi:MAG: DUF305 domain-containing protein [Candidatus Baltobacteraceae bacterium]|jgi:uncharacterized protein (DUF305 family)